MTNGPRFRCPECDRGHDFDCGERWKLCKRCWEMFKPYVTGEGTVLDFYDKERR